MSQPKSLVEIQKEVHIELANKEAVKMLLATTFKGLSEQIIPQAITEGMIRGFDFKNFLQKDIYAVPYGSGYSLVTSIDWARKIGSRSGIVGKDEPIYGEEEDMGLWCSVTVKKQFPTGYIGDFTSKVYLKEYYAGHKNPDGSIKKGKFGDMKENLWDTKQRTMIAKVAEMHALRMACPEELAQAYVEEELEARDTKPAIVVLSAEDKQKYVAKLDATTDLESLKTVWASLPAEAKNELETYKETLKAKYDKGNVQ